MSIDRKLGPTDRQILDDASANHKLLIAIDAPRVELAKQKERRSSKWGKCFRVNIKQQTTP